MRRTLLPRLCLLLLVPCLTHGADRWAQLKLGMTADETVAALGEPLVRNSGRGFELWIYDRDAEVLFFGDLIGWTTPSAGPVSHRVADVWLANQGRDDFRTVLARLPAPRTKRIRHQANAADVREVTWRPTLRFRP